MARVLLAYETKHGSTLQTAGLMAEQIRRADHQAEVRRARDVKTLGGYDAVILGAPLYYGRWNGDAMKFVRRHGEALARVPFRVFALGPTTSDRTDAAYAREGDRVRSALARSGCPANARIEVFGGVIDPAKLHFPFSRMDAGDWRPWPLIEAWVADLLRQFDGTSPAAGFLSSE